MITLASSPVPDPPPRILFIDDDADVRKAAALLLPRRGFSLRVAAGPEEGWSLLAEAPADVVLLDLNFGAGATTGAEGLACIGRLLAHDPDAVIVVVTGHSGIAIAVAAMRAGAVDFVMKPWNNERLVATLTEAAVLRRCRLQAAARPADATPDVPVIGESSAVRHVLELLRRAAPTAAAILLTGEAGTGKTLLARTIHRLSPRTAQPLHVLDPSVPDLTGWVSGDPAGTLLVEAIEIWPEPMRALLSGLLDQHPALRIVATSRMPLPMLRDRLPADLLYRLGTVELALPPLRARGGDVRLLAEHALRLAARRHVRGALRFSADALAALAAGDFPDNVRGLLQVVERAAVLAPPDAVVLTAADIPLAPVLPGDVAPPAPGEGDLNLARSERAMVQAALRRHGFNVSHAARELGLTRAALYRRMARHAI